MNGVPQSKIPSLPVEKIVLFPSLLIDLSSGKPQESPFVSHPSSEAKQSPLDLDCWSGQGWPGQSLPGRV